MNKKFLTRKVFIVVILFYTSVIFAQEKLSGVVQIDLATSEDNNSPGITVLLNDDFLYDGQYLNHYGFGFHNYQDNSSSLNGRNAYLSGYFGIDFFTGGINRLRINKNGFVGIGTTSPEYKLDVAGTIRAEEILVEAETADFVFDENYDLKDLSEIEEYIRIHKHLPDIPSAEEMEKSGVNLAEMNKLLLQKVEELTLYLVEKDKEMYKLKEDCTEEKHKRISIEERLSNLETLLK